MATENSVNPNWAPFIALPGSEHAPPPRLLSTPQGIADRLRAVAFAELQAREAFRWAHDRFTTAPQALRSAWMGLVAAEDKHYQWLMRRMEELQIDPRERPVSLKLWESYMKCDSAEEFALYMATAEERGRIAGERFYENLKATDAVTGEIFKKIAEEEVEHIELAYQFFPHFPRPLPIKKK